MRGEGGREISCIFFGKSQGIRRGTQGHKGYNWYGRIWGQAVEVRIIPQPKSLEENTTMAQGGGGGRVSASGIRA